MYLMYVKERVHFQVVLRFFEMLNIFPNGTPKCFSRKQLDYWTVFGS